MLIILRVLWLLSEVQHTQNSPTCPDIGYVAVFQMGSMEAAWVMFRSHAAWKIYFHSFSMRWLCLLPSRRTIVFPPMTCSNDELHWGPLLPTSPILPPLLEPAFQQHGGLGLSSQFTSSTAAFLVFLWNLSNGPTTSLLFQPFYQSSHLCFHWFSLIL